MEDFTQKPGLYKPSLYFEIRLYKFFKKLPLFKNSMLSSYYFKNHFKVIKNVCKTSANLFL